MASAPLPHLQTTQGRAARRQRTSTGSTPGKRVIITEKPSMGRAVAAALGATARRTGYLEGSSDLVTWCVGHLVELDAPETYNPAWKQWRMADLPLCPAQFTYHPAEPTRDQFNVITQLLGRADVTTVVNAADAGREGELIFDLVYTLARCRKPVERLWISSLTRDAILAGFRNLKPAEALSRPARLGARAPAGRLARRHQRHARADGARPPRRRRRRLSLGRVQTPTLALIVERDQEIAEPSCPSTTIEVVATFQRQRGLVPRPLVRQRPGSRFDNAGPPPTPSPQRCRAAGAQSSRSRSRPRGSGRRYCTT